MKSSRSIRLSDVRRRLFLEPLESRQLMAIDLEVALRVTDSTQTIAQPGVDVTQLNLNDAYQVRGTVRDLRAGGIGVFQAYVDVDYNAGADVDGAAIIGPDFAIGQQTGTAGATSDVNIGGSGGANTTTDPQTLFLLPMLASTAGVYVFTPDLTGDQVLFPSILRINDGVDPATETDLIPDSITILPDIDAIANPAAVNEDAGPINVGLTGIDGGVGANVVVTATPANPGLVGCTVTYTSADPTGTVVCTPVANASGTTTVAVDVTVNGATRTQTFTIQVNEVPDSPVIALPPGGTTVTFTEQDPPLHVAPLAVVTDGDSPANFNNGLFTAAITAGSSPTDALVLENQGVGAGQIGVNGTNVTFANVVIGTLTPTANPIGFTVALNAQATPAAVQALTRAVTFEAPGNNPTPGARAVTLSLNDGTVAPTGSTEITVNVAAVNDAPNVNVLPATANYPSGGGAIIAANASTVTDVDSTTFNTGSLVVTITAGGTVDDRLAIRNEGTGVGQVGVIGTNVTFGGTLIGTLNIAPNGGPLTVSFNAASTPAAAQAVVRNITFGNVGTPPAAQRTLQFAVTDDNNTTTTDDLTINITVSTPPVVTLTPIPVAYNENAAAIVLDGSAQITDADSIDFDGGSLKVEITTGVEALDDLSIRNEGTAAGQIGVNGPNVTFGNVLIGTIDGINNGLNGFPLVIHFQGAAATPAAAQALARNITFRSDSDTPVLVKTVAFTADDGDGGSGSGNLTVNTTAINDDPVVTFPAVAVTFVEDQPPVFISTGATVADPDSPNFNGGTLTVTVGANGEITDDLVIDDEGNGLGQIGVAGQNVSYENTVIGTFIGGLNGVDLEVAFNANATPAAVQQLLRRITFASTSQDPSALTRTIQATLTDGDNGTGVDTVDVGVTPVNDAPVLTLLPLGDTAFTEGMAGNEVLIAPATILTDIDSDFINGVLTVETLAGGETADQFVIRNQGGGAGQVGVNGANVSYEGIVVGVIDPVNNGVNGADLVVTFNAAATEPAAQAVVRNILFRNASQNPAETTRQVRFTITDGDGLNDVDLKNVTVTEVNDPPLVTLSGEGVTITQLQPSKRISAVPTVLDPDSPNFDTGSLTVDITANGTTDDRLEFLAGGPVTLNGTDVLLNAVQIGVLAAGGDGVGLNPLKINLNANATPTSLQTVISNIVYRHNNPVAAEPARTVEFVVDDGEGGISTAAAKQITILGANQNPLVTLPVADLAYTENDAPTLIAPTGTVTDDGANLNGGFLSVVLFANATADDRLTVTPGGNVTLNNNDVLVNNVIIGTIAAGQTGNGTDPLRIDLNANATPAAVEDVLQAITYENVSNKPSTLTRTVRVTVDDGVGGSDTDDRDIVVTAVNDPPVIAVGVNVDYTENGVAVIVSPNTAVTDPDSDDFNTGMLTVSITLNNDATDFLEIRNEGAAVGQIGVVGTDVTFGGATIGSFVGGTGTTPLVITFNSAAATPAAVQALARNITFRTTSDNPPTAKTIRFVVTDGDNGSDQDEIGVTITVTNDPPSVTLSPEAVTFTENQAAVIITTTPTVTDPDSLNFDTGSLTVSIVTNAEAADRLEIRQQGNAVGQINLAGTNVTFGGVTIGSLGAGGGQGTTPLVITLNANATPAAVQALVANITYHTDSENPSVLTRTVRFVLDDGDGGTDTAEKEVEVEAVNDPPVQTLTAGAAAYTEGGTAIIIDAGATVTDVDSPNFDTGTLTVSIPTGGDATDTLAIRNEGTASGQIGVNGTSVTFGGVVIGTISNVNNGQNGNSLVVTFNAGAIPAAVQALERNITFVSSSANPILAKTVRFVVTDGDTGSDSDDKTLNVTAVNQAPVQTLTAGPLAYTENAAATVIDAGITVTDIDSADFNTGSLTVSLFTGGEATDLLKIQNQGTNAGQIGVNGANVTFGGTTIGTFTGGNGTTPLVITFNSAAATPAVVQALERAIQFSSTSDNPTPTKVVRFVVADGDGGSDSDDKTINITVVNDPPVQTLTAANLSYVENAAATLIDPAATVTDPDGADFNTGSLTVSISTGGEATDQLAVRNEGVASGQIGVNGANITFGGTTIGTFTGGNGTTPLVITFTSAAATPAAVQALERNITFLSTSDNPTAIKTVRFVVNDGDGGSDTDERSITVTLVNDAPVQTLSTETVTFTQGGGAVVISATGTVTDVDSANFDTGSLTVSVNTNGTADDRLDIRNDGVGAGQIGVSGSNVTFGGVTIGTFTGGTGTTPLVITFNASATPTSVQALERAIRFSNVAAVPTTTARTVRFVLSDGDGGSDTDDKQVAVVAIQQAPVVTLSTETVTYTENATAVSVGATSNVTDADSTNFDTGVLTITLTAGGQAEDRLEIRNDGAGSGQIGVSGSNVTFGGTTIGTFTGGTGTTPLVITLNASATPAATQALLRNVTFRSVSENPSTTSRTVSVTLTDGDGGTSTAVTKSVAVVAVNDAPVNSVPVTQTVAANTAIVFSTANGNAISVTDVDAGTAEIDVTITVTNGVLSLSGVSGLTFVQGDGNTDAVMRFRGTAASVNAALNASSFLPTTGFTGEATVTLVTNDQGNTGTGGSLSDTDSFTVRVGNGNVAGSVFNDSDRSGVREADELGIPNVSMTITGIDAANANITKTVRTAADGTFSFSSLPAGQYRITQVQPDNFTDGVISGGGGVQDAAGYVVTVASGQNLSGVSFAEEGLILSKITLQLFLASTPPKQAVINQFAPVAGQPLRLASSAATSLSAATLLGKSAAPVTASSQVGTTAARQAVQAATSRITTAVRQATTAATRTIRNVVSSTPPAATTAAAKAIEDKLSQVEVAVADLPGDLLALTQGYLVTFDLDAAGQGWFNDPTPNDNEEFFSQLGRLTATDDRAAGRVDLLTVAAHELGHVLGLGDLGGSHNDGDLMSDDLLPGVRKEPGDELIDALFGN